METPEGQNSAVVVLGGGSWGTALVKILTENNLAVHWWLRREASAAHIRQYGHNPDYLSHVSLPVNLLHPTTSLEEVLNGSASVVFIAVPAAFLEQLAEEFPAGKLKDKVVVSAVKGMVPGANKIVTDFLRDKFNLAGNKMCVVGGPCHSEEVAMERQSYLTVAGSDSHNVDCVKNVLACRFVNAIGNFDLYGVEYCAVIKNIIALACGIAHGLNYGDNFQAVLLSNAMQEIRRFLQAVSPGERDMFASAYLGDLLVTSYSRFSRNRMFGNMIGRGYTVQATQMEMNMIAEGYYAVSSIHQLNESLKVSMPVVETVYRILYENNDPGEAFEMLTPDFN